MPAVHSGATPFSVHQEKTSAVPVSRKSKKERKSDKSICDDESVLNEAFDRLQDSIDHLTMMTEQKECNGCYHLSRSGSRPYKRNPPLKPMITRWQRNRYSQSSTPFHRTCFYPPAQYQHNRFPAHNRGSNRYHNDCYSDGCRGFQFDKSPRGRKPRVASKTLDQDRNYNYNYTVTIVMSLGTLHVNVCMLRNWKQDKVAALVMPILQERNVSLVGNHAIIMLLSSLATKTIKLLKMWMSSMILKWIT